MGSPQRLSWASQPVNPGAESGPDIENLAPRLPGAGTAAVAVLLSPPGALGLPSAQGAGGTAEVLVRMGPNV